MAFYFTQSGEIDMPVYESEIITREKLEELRKRNKCAICGEWLATYYDTEKKLAFIACHVDTSHDGIAKDYEYCEKNIPTRRKETMESQGEVKAKLLDKYMGSTALTRPQAMEILEIIWPDAPSRDKMAAAILCSSYGLNPLANHVFLIKFHNKRLNRDEWTRVWGIKAKRLLASRKGGYSYLDMTPRLMTEEEQIKVWGHTQTGYLCYLTWLKDMKSGAEVYGYGKWPEDQEPYGTDKGNTKANMASIRSESLALDRLRPAEMPSGFAVADEQYIEGESRLVDVTTGEITEPVIPPELSQEAIKSTGKVVEEKVSAVASTEAEVSSLAKDETPITKEQLTHITQLLNDNQMGATDLGKWMAEKKWDMPKKMADIKVWQYNEICTAFERGK
jgi:hypothetical protein